MVLPGLSGGLGCIWEKFWGGVRPDATLFRSRRGWGKYFYNVRVVKGTPDDIKVDVAEAWKIDVAYLFLNSYIPSVYIKGQEVEVMHC